MKTQQTAWLRQLCTKRTKLKASYYLTSKIYYKTIIIKTVWHWHKLRDIDRWNRIEPINRPMHHQLLFNQKPRCQEQTMGTKVLSTVALDCVDIHVTLDPQPKPHLKNQLTAHRRLGWETWNRETPRRKCRGEAPYRWSWQWFGFNVMPKIQSAEAKISKRDRPYQTKKTVPPRKWLTGWRDHLQNGRKYLQTVYLIKG